MPDIEDTGPSAEQPVASMQPKPAAALGRGSLLIAFIAMLCLIIGPGAPLILRPFSRPVIQVAIPASQSGRLVQEVLSKWDRKNFDIDIVPLSHDNLFKAEIGNTGQFDVLMVDDPWLAQLATLHKLKPVPRPKFDNYLPKFVPEFLRLSYYRNRYPRRPELAALTANDQVHVDIAKLKKVGDDYGFYALPFLGNTQAIVRNNASTGETKAVEVMAKPWSDLISKTPYFLMRMGTNNGALADFLPILWAEGGCLIRTDSAGHELSGLHKSMAAEKAFNFSLAAAAAAPLQHARFNDDDVQTYLLKRPDSIAISWLAYRKFGTPQTITENKGSSVTWYGMPPAEPVNDPANDGCSLDEPRVEAGKQGPGTLGVWLLAVSSNSSHPAQAWDFIQWAFDHLPLPATGATAAGSCASTGEIEPADKDLLKGYPTPFEDQLSCGAQVAVRHSAPRPSHPKWNEIEDAVGLRIRQMHWRTLTSTEVVDSADCKLHEIIENESVEDLSVRSDREKHFSSWSHCPEIPIP